VKHGEVRQGYPALKRERNCLGFGKARPGAVGFSSAVFGVVRFGGVLSCSVW
jgi:hypothetical protein